MFFGARWRERGGSVRLEDGASALSDHTKVCDGRNGSVFGCEWTVRDMARGCKDSFVGEGVAIRQDRPGLDGNTPAWVQCALFWLPFTLCSLICLLTWPVWHGVPVLHVIWCAHRTRFVCAVHLCGTATVALAHAHAVCCRVIVT